MNEQVEEFEAAVGHLRLDRLDARVVGVLGRLSSIVELRVRARLVELLRYLMRMRDEETTRERTTSGGAMCSGRFPDILEAVQHRTSAV